LKKSKELRDKEDATKEEIDTWIEEIQKELQELMQKFQATTENTGGNPDDEIEDKSWEKNEVEGEVIDADEVSDEEDKK
jgi:ribosomal protein L29